MAAGAHNFQIRAGNSGIEKNPAGLVVGFKDGNGVEEDLSGSTFHFKTKPLSGVSIQIEGITSGNTVTVPFTVADSRLLPAGKPGQAGRLVYYELEQRTGTAERSRLVGYVEILGGINDDS